MDPGLRREDAKLVIPMEIGIHSYPRHAPRRRLLHRYTEKKDGLATRVQTTPDIPPSRWMLLPVT